MIVNKELMSVLNDEKYNGDTNFLGLIRESLEFHKEDDMISSQNLSNGIQQAQPFLKKNDQDSLKKDVIKLI